MPTIGNKIINHHLPIMALAKDRGKTMITFLGLVVVNMLNLQAEAAELPSYSFTANVVRTQPGLQEGRGMMYVSPEGIRTEGVKDGEAVWMIYNLSNKKAWLVFPKREAYVAIPGQYPGVPLSPEDPQSPCRTDKSYQCTSQANEVLANRWTTKWEINHTIDANTADRYHLWIDREMGIPIREAYAGGVVMELKDIRIGKINSQLFQIPSGFKELTQPAANEMNKPSSEAVSPSQQR